MLNTIQLEASDDLSRLRRQVAERTKELEFNVYDQTRLVTAASELARNILSYAGSGEVLVEKLVAGEKVGLRLTFKDSGPGIEDVDLALSDGYSTGRSLGLGLGGARRLVQEFEIRSDREQGTRIIIARWSD